jgi:hypothetical protein
MNPFIRSRIALAAVLLAAGLAVGPAVPAAEPAEGGTPLMEGDQPTGWVIEGDSQVVDGILVLGGTRPTRARVRTELGDNFELRVEYRVEGGPMLRVEGNSIFSGWTSTTSLNQPSVPSGWMEVIYTGRHDPESQTTIVKERHRGLGEADFGERDVSSASGVSGHVSLGFEVPAGSKLHIRNARLKSDPPSRRWLLPFAGAGLLLFLAVLAGIGFWYVKRRRAAKVRTEH